MGLPFSKRQILDSSKLKEYADVNENGRNISKRVENIVGKKEISPFLTVFSRDLY